MAWYWDKGEAVMYKNLNQLKQGVQVGQKVKVTNVMRNMTKDRVVTEVRTNGISTGNEISHDEYLRRKGLWLAKGNGNIKEIDGRYFTTTRLDYQKAKHMQFEGNTVKFLAFDYDSHGNTVTSPSPDFKDGDVWLELEFID